MAEYSAPFDSIVIDGEPDRPLGSEGFGRLLSAFFSEGVFNTKNGLGFKLNTNGDMTVTLLPGCAYLNEKWYENDEPLLLTLDPAHGTLNRIDTIVVRKDYVGRIVYASVLKGSNSVNPIPVAMSRNPNTYYDLHLYRIRVKAGVTRITQSDVTDLRTNSELCGVVAMAADHIDTTTLYNQVQSDLSHFRNDTQGEYNSWTAEKKAAYDVYVALRIARWDEFDESFKQSHIADFEQWYPLFKSKHETDVATWFADLKDTIDDNQAANLYNMIDAHRNTKIINESGSHGMRIKGNRLQLETATGWAMTNVEIITGATFEYLDGLDKSCMQWDGSDLTWDEFEQIIMIEE